MSKRGIVEILELWGEWERSGRNYTKHLQPKSGLLMIDVVVVREDEPPLPTLDDDEAALICRKMAIIKTQSPYNYRVLKMRYMNCLSIPRLTTYLKVGRPKCYELLTLAEFYAEEVILFDEKVNIRKII